jgi:signal transduction histidine kinase
MNTIVSDLNDLTKIQVGSLRLEYKPVQVGETLSEVVRSLRRQIEEKSLQLETVLPDDLPAVWADPLRLGQILTNLVSNAQKYTLQGGRVLIGGERCSEQPGQPAALQIIHIWVQDDGIGIAAEDQSKIFQQYFRTDISKETAPGTGLGLSITKSLIEMQGGQIWFESEMGRGTTFHITLPVAEA